MILRRLEAALPESRSNTSSMCAKEEKQKAVRADKSLLYPRSQCEVGLQKAVMLRGAGGKPKMAFTSQSQTQGLTAAEQETHPNQTQTHILIQQNTSTGFMFSVWDFYFPQNGQITVCCRSEQITPLKEHPSVSVRKLSFFRFRDLKLKSDFS